MQSSETRLPDGQHFQTGALHLQGGGCCRDPALSGVEAEAPGAMGREGVWQGSDLGQPDCGACVDGRLLPDGLGEAV